MPDAKTLVKIGSFAGLGTGIVCLVDGLIWDLLPFNQYQGMFWLTFMPLILVGGLVPPMTLNGIDLFIIFTAGIVVTFLPVVVLRSAHRKIRAQGQASRSARF